MPWWIIQCGTVYLKINLFIQRVSVWLVAAFAKTMCSVAFGLSLTVPLNHSPENIHKASCTSVILNTKIMTNTHHTALLLYTVLYFPKVSGCCFHPLVSSQTKPQSIKIIHTFCRELLSCSRLSCVLCRRSKLFKTSCMDYHEWPTFSVCK